MVRESVSQEKTSLASFGTPGGIRFGMSFVHAKTLLQEIFFTHFAKGICALEKL